jgi:hypothetical protein
LLSTRISHSADGPLKVMPWICTGSKECASTWYETSQARATASPVPMPPSHFHTPQPL